MRKVNEKRIRVWKQAGKRDAQQSERKEISTEIRNEVLTGKVGIKEKLLGYEEVNLTRLYIYVHAYNQMVNKDERIVIDYVNPEEESEIGNLDRLLREFQPAELLLSDNYDIKKYMDTKELFDYFDENENIANPERPADYIETFIYRVGGGMADYKKEIEEYDFQIGRLANAYGTEHPEIKCERDEYGYVRHYDLSIEQISELIRKYDLKELYGVEYQIDDTVMLKSYDE